MARMLFEVYNTFGDLIAKGNSSECAKALGISDVTFLHYANELYASTSRFKIVKTFQPEVTLAKTRETAAQIKKWDDWATPLRDYFGIPVYRPGKDGR